jgi:hypothetical protein
MGWLGIVAAHAPTDLQKNAVWRCMDGREWGCHLGANLSCQEKAETPRVPTGAMQHFCEAKPKADSMPAAVTGRATVNEWRCTEGQPRVVRQLLFL